jgi:hypothetical protein
MPSCFVVMGFNKKTDPNTGKVFDLDKAISTSSNRPPRRQDSNASGPMRFSIQA